MRIQFAFLISEHETVVRFAMLSLRGGKISSLPLIGFKSSRYYQTQSRRTKATALYYTCEMQIPNHQNNFNSRLKIQKNATGNPITDSPSRMASPNNIHPRPHAGEYLPTSPVSALSSRKAPCSCAEHGPCEAQRYQPEPAWPHGSIDRHKLAVNRIASAIPADTERCSSDSRTCSSSAAHNQSHIAGGDRTGFGSGFDVASCLRSRWQP